MRSRGSCATSRPCGSKIQAHTDNASSDAKTLTQERADAVRAYLISAGVAGERLVAKGYGETLPVASNGSAWGRAKNRRIQLVIVGGGASVPQPVEVGLGSDTLSQLTKDEIDHVVAARARVFRVCFEKELQRNPNIAGKLVVRFKIAADGHVESASATAGTTLNNDAVTACVTRNLMLLKFPAKDSSSLVNYPFVFHQ